MKRILISIINFYQKLPLSSHSMCRYVPTCSSYAKESINTYGAIYGSFLAIKRILRCNPFSNAPLYDPVPLKKERKNEKY